MANRINGLHLIVDGRVKDSKVFARDNLQELMKQLVTALEMQCIWGPEFREVELDPEKLTGDKFRDEGGTSGFCLINKSHIAVHVWPLRRQFMLDIASCDDFSQERALDAIRKSFRSPELKVHSLYRCP